MLAQTILELGDVAEGEWPLLGDRFINPDAIILGRRSSAGRSLTQGLGPRLCPAFASHRCGSRRPRAVALSLVR